MVLPLIYTLIFILCIRYARLFREPGLHAWVPSLLFLIKVAAGMVLTYIYTHVYTDRANADIFKYFDDARIMYDSVWDHPGDYVRMLTGIGNDTDYFNVQYYNRMDHWYRVWESVVYNDNHTIIRWNAFVMLFSGGNFHVHTVFMCLFSFTGIWFLYRALKYFMDKTKHLILLLGVFLLPSFLFWTSGVLKEGLLVFAAGILLYWMVQSLTRKLRWIELAGVALLLVMLSLLKSYWLVALIPAWIGMLFSLGMDRKRKLWPFLLIYGLCVVGFLALPMLKSEYDMIGVFKQKQDDFYRLAEFMQSGSVINIPRLDGTMSNFFLNVPAAVFNGLFRPLPLESFSPLIAIASLESLWIMLTFLLLIFKNKALGDLQISFVWFVLGFSVVLAIMSGLVTPVLGALVRYRILAFPFLWALFVMVLPEGRIPKWLRLSYQSSSVR